jgi:1,4-dihydroxy-2-naphthoate polyprenyltransferase
MKTFVRALRLPFITASVLPFVFGSLIETCNFSLLNFILGLLAVIATHLSANLVNDYADSKSGADWQDKNYYNFFGGSKLIQEKVLSEKFYLKTAIAFAVAAVISVVLLSINLQSPLVMGYYAAIIFLSWSYSAKPLRFSYRRVGEVFIFLLFGPALVMGGYFIQTGIFPDFQSFLLSVPFGLLTTAILFANEVPDFMDDIKAGKFTWVSLFGLQRSYLIYYLLLILALAAVAASVFVGFLNPVALAALVLIFPGIKAANILRRFPGDKQRLMDSSRLTIAIQAIASIILIIGIVL